MSAANLPPVVFFLLEVKIITFSGYLEGKWTVDVAKILEPLVAMLLAKMAKDAIKQAVGRPSLTAKSVESPQIKVRVPVKLKKALDKEAKRRGETNSAIVREALEKYLKSA